MKKVFKGFMPVKTRCSFYLFYKQFSPLVERGKICQKKCGEKYPQRPLGRYNQMNQSN